MGAQRVGQQQLGLVHAATPAAAAAALAHALAPCVPKQLHDAGPAVRRPAEASTNQAHSWQCVCVCAAGDHVCVPAGASWHQCGHHRGPLHQDDLQQHHQDLQDHTAGRRAHLQPQLPAGVGDWQPDCVLL